MVTKYLTWVMVGMGNAYPVCGKYSAWTVRCRQQKSEGDGHKLRKIKHSCHRLLCPECHREEINKRSHVIAERLSFVRKKFYMDGVKLDWVETILYPPKTLRDESFGTVDGYKKLMSKYLSVMADFGIIGGVRFVHTTSVDRENGGNYKEYEKYKRGEPSTVKYNPHVQGVGLRIPNWKALKEKQDKWIAAGWFVRINYADGRTGNKPWKKLWKKIRYELGHADMGVDEDGHKRAFNAYYGAASYIKVTVEERVSLEPEKCKCGSDCWLWWEDERREIAMLKTVEREYAMMPGTIERAVLKYKLERGVKRSESLDGWEVINPEICL